MRELYNEFFCIPKNGKISEKVMLIRVAVTTILMIVCLAAMSITAYAYFSYSVASASCIISTATYSISISSTDATLYDENNVIMLTDNDMGNNENEILTVSGNDVKTVSGNDASENTLSTVSGNDIVMFANNQISDIDLPENATVYVCVQEADIYRFELTATGTATTGYCKVTIIGEEDSPYFTAQIKPNEKLDLNIEADPGTVVVFEPAWGTSTASVSNDGILNNGSTIIAKRQRISD